MMPNLDSGKWSIFDKAENLRATLDAGFNHYHQDHGALQRSNDIYIYIHTRNSFQLDSVSERDASQRNFEQKHFPGLGGAIFFDINGCLNSIGPIYQLFNDLAPAGDCRKCL